MRWNLPDRIFFGHGACHILAGVYQKECINTPLRPYWIKPDTHPGLHVFVTDGQIAFDYHGYSQLNRLLAHHSRVWVHQYADWQAVFEPIEINLLNTEDLNASNMRGPDQYHGDPIERATAFIRRIDHAAAIDKVRAAPESEHPPENVRIRCPSEDG